MKPILVCAAVAFLWCGCGQNESARAQASERPERRADALKQFDKNHDGRLDDNEREVMRKERFAERLNETQSGRGGFRFQFPPEIVKKYDKDGDGNLNEEEAQAAREGMRKQWEQVMKKYDTNKNGTLDEDEMEVFQKDAEAGKIEGVPRFFGRRGMRGGGQVSQRDQILRDADADHDGRLSEAELQAARKRLEDSRPESK